MSVKQASLFLFVVGVILCVLLGVFAKQHTNTIRTDLNDLPPEAVAPRNHSGAEWI